MATNTEYKAKTGFDYDGSNSEYIIKLRKKRNLWWLLLLLLLPLLFINLKKDITVQVFDENDQPEIGATVDFDFVASYLYKKGDFFANDTVRLRGKTGDDGRCVFPDCGYSVYSFIFKMFKRAHLEVSSPCFQTVEKTPFYHFMYGVTDMRVKRDKTDLVINVLDKKDRSPINRATVYYEYGDGKVSVSDSLITNANGEAVIKNITKCAVIDKITATCYAYKPATITGVDVIEALTNPDKRTILLEPVEEAFTFFVESCTSGKRLPDAKAEITFTKSGSSVTQTAYTNTNGKGIGDGKGHIIAQLGIKVSKRGFKDGMLQGNYTVEQFKKLPDKDRTICLEPEPQTCEFRNIDSLCTSRGIAGVTNRITVKNKKGTETLTEISSTDGTFSISPVYEDDEVCIESSHQEYESKTTCFTFQQGNSIQKEIAMMPNIVRMDFNVYDKDDRTIVIQQNSDIHIQIYSDCLSVMADSTFKKSANAMSTYEHSALLLPSSISIVVEADGYRKNDYQIVNVPVRELLADPAKRDLLMEKLPTASPCTGGIEDYGNADNKVDFTKEYNMGQSSGSFIFEYNTFEAADQIIIHDGSKAQTGAVNVIFNKKEVTKKTKTERINFTNQIITIEVHATTRFTYKVNCPQ
jgi:hypothetical protein